MISYYFYAFCVVIALDRAANGGDSGECGKYGMGRYGGNGNSAATEERVAKVETARRRFTYHIVN